MRIALTGVLVNDQDRAMRFYTESLGFVTAVDLPMGPHRWLTVRSPEGAAGVELLLEPAAFPPAQVYQQALFEAGIPAAAFFSDDLLAEVERLRARGVAFRGEPQRQGCSLSILFEDGCGNLLSLVQPDAGAGASSS